MHKKAGPHDQLLPHGPGAGMGWFIVLRAAARTNAAGGRLFAKSSRFFVASRVGPANL